MNAELTPDVAMSSQNRLDGRKPRIAIMGEFSAGKSTLTNLLIGAPALPVKVTATQLPPVWISHGQGDPYRIDLADAETPVDMNDMSDIAVSDTQFIRVFHESEVLELCDLIDMPGISDPNMSSEVWERVAHFADAVIWCTHATQAWRQSESAVWESFPETFFDKSLLLLTRFDKIIGERDRDRVLRRVKHETEDLFQGVFPISLLEAIEAGEDFDRWEKSGADAFAVALIDLTNRVSTSLAISNSEFSTEKRELAKPPVSAAPPEPEIEGFDAELASFAPPSNVEVLRPSPDAGSPEPQVVPRRLKPRPGAAGKTERLSKEEADAFKF